MTKIQIYTLNKTLMTQNGLIIDTYYPLLLIATLKKLNQRFDFIFFLFIFIFPFTSDGDDSLILEFLFIF